MLTSHSEIYKKNYFITFFIFLTKFLDKTQREKMQNNKICF